VIFKEASIDVVTAEEVEYWKNKMRGGNRVIFPFTAIVDQEEMKLGLILNVIDPSIGGVLIMGERKGLQSQQLSEL
jgi:hypothetical protein